MNQVNKSQGNVSGESERSPRPAQLWQRLRAAGVRHFRGRDLILILRPVIRDIQPFYRSTGTSSHMPGRWLPFDGLRFDGWFEKERFTQGRKYADNDPLHRFGTEELREISDQLADESISEPSVIDDEPRTVNEWIFKWQNTQRACAGRGDINETA